MDRAWRRASSGAAEPSGARAHRASSHAQTTSSPEGAAEPAPRALRALHVLLVEDNAVNREVATALLEKQGHRVKVAVNGHEALAALEALDAIDAGGDAKGGFDIVLMDVQMPVMGGYEATAAIRSKERTTERHIPILAMTAHAMAGDRERCLASGMDGYIAKPIRQELLRDAMTELLPDAVGPAASGSSPEAPASPVPAVGKTPALDRAALMERMGGDAKLVRKIGRLFVEDCPGMLARIRRAIARGDAEALRSEAHTLKGSAANFVATATVEAAARLEAQGRSGDLDGAKAAVALLARELRRLMKSLGALGAGAKRRAKPTARRAAKKAVKKMVKKTGMKTPRPGSKGSTPARKRTSRARSKSGAARSRRRNR
jgi:CheY-like chemotaxis protein/HPt (histidine-containing phosphotransfer) domain-containing protein